MTKKKTLNNKTTNKKGKNQKDTDKTKKGGHIYPISEIPSFFRPSFTSGIFIEKEENETSARSFCKLHERGKGKGKGEKRGKKGVGESDLQRNFVLYKFQTNKTTKLV